MSITYEIRPIETSADGVHYRLIATYDGPYRRGQSLRHIERLSAKQARDLLDSLTDELGGVQARRWSHGDGDSVQCQQCRSTWAADTLYKTGDVLRCPGCDGVMRP